MVRDGTYLFVRGGIFAYSRFVSIALLATPLFPMVVKHGPGILLISMSRFLRWLNAARYFVTRDPYWAEWKSGAERRCFGLRRKMRIPHVIVSP